MIKSFFFSPSCITVIVICADKAKVWVLECDKKVHTDIDSSIITENLYLAAADCGLAF